MESEVNAFLAGYTPGVQMIVYELRALVLDVVPEAIEQIDVPAKLIAYGFRQTYKDTICVIMPLKAGVNLGFPRGIDLPDPASLLTGTGKKARHVRITTIEDVKATALRALLEAAVAKLRSPNP